jgi:hypothetical protein
VNFLKGTLRNLCSLIDFPLVPQRSDDGGDGRRGHGGDGGFYGVSMR